jgi:hypothetical protein
MRKPVFLVVVVISLISGITPPPLRSEIYKDKEDCLQKNSIGNDKKMINLLCDSIVYESTKEEKKKMKELEVKRDKQREESRNDARQQRWSDREKEREKDPTFIRQQQEAERKEWCRLQKEGLPAEARHSWQLLSSKCWDLMYR